MKRSISALRYALGLAFVFALSIQSGLAAPTISNPEILAVRTGDAGAMGTERTWFIFRAQVAPSADTSFLVGQPQVWIDPDTASPPTSRRFAVNMQRDFSPGRPANSWVAYIRGIQIAGGTIGANGAGVPRNSTWTIFATEVDGSGNVSSTGSPSPPGSVSVHPSRVYTDTLEPAIMIMPVTPTGADDKAPGVGQNGNGLRVNPEDSTSPNDGGGAHIFTWRVRVTTRSGMPPAIWDTRYTDWNNLKDSARLPEIKSGVLLVLTAPGGEVLRCPMEIEPGQAVNNANTYLTVQSNPLVVQPVANSAYTSGVFYRYQVMPTQYTPAPFGGDLQSMPPQFTVPDGLPSNVTGNTIGGIVTGRPHSNVYAAFARLDSIWLFAPFMPPPPMPFYTQVAGRAGQYSYYYIASIDFRPDLDGDNAPAQGNHRAVATNNTVLTSANVNTLPVGSYEDREARSPDLYRQLADSDDPMGYPGRTDPQFQYRHPFVTPILTDGHWTDDLPENRPLQFSPTYTGEVAPPYSGANSVASNARRSRVTTKTRVRFQVRVTHQLPGGNPGPITVRLWMGPANGTMQPYTMQVEPNQGALNYANGVVYYYDAQFPAGQEGRKVYYFEADDGRNRAIWPRRPLSTHDPFGRFEDSQGASLPNRSELVLFGTGTVGKNYVAEPHVNSRPVLSNGSVSPVSGVEGQAYTYTVTYRDADNDLPLDAWVIIDNDPVNHRYRMELDPADIGRPTSQGVRYRFVLTQLPANLTKKHSFYFQFRDNWAPGAPIRREYGEWVTLPQGDDNGNPSGVIEGPTIIENRSPVLTNVGIQSSDQAFNTATRFDIFVTYKDADSEPPGTLKAFVELYDVATNARVSNDNGHTLVRVSGGTPNYVVGEQYHLPAPLRFSLPPVGQEYRVRFVTNDGKIPDVGLVTVGDGSSSDALNTWRTLRRIGAGLYDDPNGTRNWELNTPGNTTMFVWVVANGTTTLLSYNPADPPAGDYQVDGPNGRLQLTTDPGPNALVRISYRYQETVGPVVRANNVPVLTPPPGGIQQNNFLTCVPLQGGLTQNFEFAIFYQDADNQAPVADDGTEGVMLSLDNNATRLKMTRDPNTPVPVDYRSPVKYILTRTGAQLGLGNHSYHFEATDGGADVGRYPLPAPEPGPYELPGPNVIELGALSGSNIVPFPKGLSNQLYEFTITYQNDANQPPSKPIEIRYTGPSGTQHKAVMNLIDNPPNYATGVRYRLVLKAEGYAGVDNVGDPARLEYGLNAIGYGFQDNPDQVTGINLTVNKPPALSAPDAPLAVVDPNPASRGGLVTFRVKYTDLNGDPPVDPVTGAPRIKLWVKNTAGNYVEVTTPAPATLVPNPADTNQFPRFPAPTADAIKLGQVFQWTVAVRNLPDGHVPGVRDVLFTARDDFNSGAVLGEPWDVNDLPLERRGVKLEFPGALTIEAGQPPVLEAPTPGTGVNDGTLSATIGRRTDTFTYTVIYKHPQGVPPTVMQLRIFDAGGSLVKTVSPPQLVQTGADYVAGVTFTYTTTPNEFTPGAYTYSFTAEDQVSGPVNLPAAGRFNGPYVNNPPTLENGTVYIQARGAGSAPTVVNGALNPPLDGTVVDRYIFRVTYKDTDAARTPTGTVTVSTNDPNNPGPIAMTLVSGNPADPAGAIYESAPLQLTKGPKTFHFDANDKSRPAPNDVPADTVLDTARFPATGEITGLAVFSIPELDPPDVNQPNQGTLTPLQGPFNANYTFAARYRHADGTFPVRIQVKVYDAAGAVLQNTFDMVATTPANPTPADIENGVLYTFQASGAQLGSGQHTYLIEAADNATLKTLRADGTKYTGPYVNHPPSLESGTAYLEANGPGSAPNVVNGALQPALVGLQGDRFVFRVIYKDTDSNTTPVSAVRVVTNDPANPTIPMTLRSGAPNTPGGAVFESAAVVLTPGIRTFHFEAEDNLGGVADQARFITTGEITGLTVRSILELAAPPAPIGTLTPVSGPQSTDFRYSIIYKNADGTPPSVVRVIIDEADPAKRVTLQLTKDEPGTDFVNGVRYSVTYRFARDETRRDHTYRFEAIDTLSPNYVGQFPVGGGQLVGPTLNTTIITTTPAPLADGTADAPYAFAGKVDTNTPIAAGNRTVRAQFVKPDGSGFTESFAFNADGTFAYTSAARLDQTGDWQLVLEWAGVAGVYDSVSARFPFKVRGFSVDLPVQEPDMISSPLIPTTPDPGITFSPTTTAGVPVSVTELDLVAYSPTLRGSGDYYFLNSPRAGDPSFQVLAGRGYWVFPRTALRINPRGRVWDATQPFAVNLGAGWNMVGSVFQQPINFSALQARAGGAAVNITNAASPVRPFAWTYNRATRSYQLVQASDTLIPGRAYWFFATTACELILPTPGTRGVEVGRAADFRSNALQVVARMGDRMDTDNFVPLDGSAKTRMAELIKPPYLANFVSVRFVDPDAVQLPAETRAVPAGSLVVFEVTTDQQNADVSLQFPNISTLGRRYSVSIVDLSNNSRRSLANGAGLTYNTGENTAPRRFALTIGRAALNSRLVITNVRTATRSAGGVSVTYGLSHEAVVTADIVGNNGQTIRTVSQGRSASAGSNTVLWDGRNAAGIAMPAGSYILRLKATDDQGNVATATQQILLVR